MQYLNLVDHAYPLESAAFAPLFFDSPESRVKQLIKSYAAILVFSFSFDLEENLNRITKNPVHRIPPRSVPEKRQHITRYILDRLQHTGLIDTMVKNETLPRHFLNRTTIPIKTLKPYRIIIHPGSGSFKKNWPLSRFMEVGCRLKSLGMKPEWILGPAEYHCQDELNRNDVEAEIIDDLIDLTQAFMHAAGFVGNDSGVSHLSAFLGLPTVVIFGPSDPERWAPMGNHVRIAGPDAAEKDLKCRPCFETPATACYNQVCLENISPAQVMNDLIELIPTAIQV